MIPILLSLEEKKPEEAELHVHARVRTYVRTWMVGSSVCNFHLHSHTRQFFPFIKLTRALEIQELTDCARAHIEAF